MYVHVRYMYMCCVSHLNAWTKNGKLCISVCHLCVRTSKCMYMKRRLPDAVMWDSCEHLNDYDLLVMIQL